MDNDEILDMLDNGEVLEKPSNTYNKKKSQPNQYYSNKNIEPIRLNRENMVTDHKSFTLVLSKRADELSDDVKLKLKKVMSFLASKGLTYRNNIGSKDEFLFDLYNLFDNKETYLPWRSFNPEEKFPTLNTPSELAYRILANEHRFFSKLPDNIRAILASSIHTILGKDCQKPVKFILAYSDCGSERFVKGMDYKLLGGVTLPMNIAKVYEIPLININNESFSSEKLSNLL